MGLRPVASRTAGKIAADNDKSVGGSMAARSDASSCAARSGARCGGAEVPLRQQHERGVEL